VLMADFTLRNHSAAAVKDICVLCNGFAPSGTHIDTNKRTIYQIIPPHGTISIKEFNMGFLNSQVDSVGCAVDSWKPDAD
jgi:hypothetical protein